MLHNPHRSPAQQRGVGALVVVMMLFFIMSLVAAYASRNLIFEQKTSANNYRAVQAFEAAEAGLEWAIAMLNGGRVDAACVGTDDVTQDTFRQRYLSTDASDVVDIRKWVNAGVDADLLPTCVRDAVSGWNCSCPASGAPVVAAPAGTAAAPAFQIKFFRTEVIAGKPIVRVRSQSCSNYGGRCFDPAGRESDALAEVNALVGLTASVTQAPVAALTVRGDLNASGTTVVNESGVIINSGGLINVSTDNIRGPAGSPAILRDDDETLSDILPANGMTGGERMFLATFGMKPSTYRTQPAVVRLTCGNECSHALQDLGQAYPGRVIWIDGDLKLDGTLTLGSVAAPVILVVDGNVTVGDAGNVTITGMMYSRGASWSNGAGPALVQGALVAEGDAANAGNFTITGSPTIVFDHDVVDQMKKVQARLALEFGSMARVPGSWREF